jgi:hypothetical protein
MDRVQIKIESKKCEKKSPASDLFEAFITPSIHQSIKKKRSVASILVDIVGALVLAAIALAWQLFGFH